MVQPKSKPAMFVPTTIVSGKPISDIEAYILYWVKVEDEVGEDPLDVELALVLVVLLVLVVKVASLHTSSVQSPFGYTKRSCKRILTSSRDTLRVICINVGADISSDTSSRSTPSITSTLRPSSSLSSGTSCQKHTDVQ